MRTLWPSSAALAQSSWSLLLMVLVIGPFLGRIASKGEQCWNCRQSIRGRTYWSYDADYGVVCATWSLYTPGGIGKSIWGGFYHTQRGLCRWCGKGQCWKSCWRWSSSPLFDFRNLVCQAGPSHIHCMANKSCQNCITWGNCYFV